MASKLSLLKIPLAPYRRAAASIDLDARSMPIPRRYPNLEKVPLVNCGRGQRRRRNRLIRVIFLHQI